jgi:hypothetical protein
MPSGQLLVLILIGNHNAVPEVLILGEVGQRVRPIPM